MTASLTKLIKYKLTEECPKRPSLLSLNNNTTSSTVFSFASQTTTSKCSLYPDIQPYRFIAEPPSAPRDLRWKVNKTSVKLRWSPPQSLGGRRDIFYRFGLNV